jgi:hypothetical protein
MPRLIDDEDGASPSAQAQLQSLDSIFADPIGPQTPTTPAGPRGRQPLFPETGLTAEQEKYVAGGVGAILGPGVQRGMQSSFPGREAREADAAKKLATERRMADLLRNMEEEELLRRGIDPKSMRTPTSAADTSGTKWMRNWAGVDKEIAGGVPEASAAYQRSKGQGKVTSRLSKKFGPAAGEFAGLSIHSPRYDPAVRGAAEAREWLRQADAVEAQRAARARLAAATPGPLSTLSKGLGSAFVQGPLAGAFSGLSFYEAYQRWLEGDRSGAVIEALGGLAGLATMVPGLQIPGIIAGGITTGAQYLHDRAKEPAPTQAAQPQGALGTR